MPGSMTAGEKNRPFLETALVFSVRTFPQGDKLYKTLTLSALLTAMAAPACADDEASPVEFEAQDWNLHAQSTVTGQIAPPFKASYAGPHSMNNHNEAKDTVSADLYGGVRLWDGAEAHVDTLWWQGFGLSHTLGIVSFPNGEAYKSGTQNGNFMVARAFVRQTIGLGGDQEDVQDSQLSLAGKQDVSRLTLTFGEMSFLDVFDHNTYAGDARNQFMNWGLMGNITWDYGQDTVGYGPGFTTELNQPGWTLRYGFFQLPSYVNAGNVGSGDEGIDQYIRIPPKGGFSSFTKSWSQATEFEQRYSCNSHPGAIRLLAWLDEGKRDTYNAATSLLIAQGPNADLSTIEGYHYSHGFGVNWEQEVTNSVGLFSRLGWNNGKVQATQYTDANWSASFGASIKGDAWGRPNDTVGLGSVVSGASEDNRKYLSAGGLGIEAGDGALSYGWEKVLETYYSFEVREGIRTTLDYQFVSNPAFNKDLGPISIFGVRFHAEF